MSNPEDLDSRSKQPILQSEVGMETEKVPSSDQKEFRDDRQDVENIDVENTKLSSVVLKQLALQLEYYFSTHNLSKDAYVQTLRNLNDGCVPARILANFGKVKSIVGLDGNASFHNEDCRINAIMDTIRGKYTESLQIHSIDATTGKIISDCSEVTVPGKTIIAIGTISKQPLNVDPVTTSPLLVSRTIASPASSRTKTIILRDVPLSVTEEEIKTLVNEIEGCPPITSVIKDVANCWFVSFETDEREDLMNIMMQLRSKTLGGEYVMARIKASTTALAESDMYLPFFVPFNKPCRQTSISSDGLTLKKKKKSRSKKIKNRQHPSQPSISRDVQGLNLKQLETRELSRSPVLSEEQFPMLQDEKKVEWETPLDVNKDMSTCLDDDSKSAASGDCPKSGNTLSDAASTATATTTSSSLESVHKKSIPMGGYAAALLKPAPPTVEKTKKASPATEVSVSVEPSKETVPGTKSKADDRTDVIITTPVLAWGQRRSFADILRQDNVNVAISSS